MHKTFSVSLQRPAANEIYISDERNGYSKMYGKINNIIEKKKKEIIS